MNKLWAKRGGEVKLAFVMGRNIKHTICYTLAVEASRSTS
jgi:hypothetical protein